MKLNYKVVGYSMPHFVYCEPTIYEGFTKITLKDGSVIEIKGKGKLTQLHIPSQYTYSGITKIETGLLCTSVGSHINYSSDFENPLILEEGLSGKSLDELIRENWLKAYDEWDVVYDDNPALSEYIEVNTSYIFP